MPTVEERLQALEQRLAQLESASAIPPASQWASAPARPGPADTAHKPPSKPLPRSPAPRQGTNWSVTQLLGWAGATAVVVAFAYLIRLAIVDGWLTPTRQLASAVLAGLVLITLGFRLKQADREYASLLPAGGIVILFLAIYGAHLYYGMITPVVAGVSVMAVCLGSLYLCRVFQSQIYALFAVVGSYSAPFLLGGDGAGLVDLVIYYTCWSVLFSAFSVWVGNRTVYLLAAYLALVGFDLLWKAGPSGEWLPVVIFQLMQLVIFSTCAVLYASRHQQPMTHNVALAHAPVLLIFYVLEYAVLDRHVPGMAPWIAVGSAGVLLLAYQVARRLLDQSLDGSKWLLAAYCALVLMHAGYLQSVPDALAPWFAFALLTASALYLALRGAPGLLAGPVGWVVALIFVGNYLRLVGDFNTHNVPASNLLLVVYAVQLYTGYFFLRREAALSKYATLMSYGGHIAAMTAAAYVFDGRFAVSISWAVLALGCLLLALRIRDKSLGHSSLLIFAISTVKVLAFDLSDAAPIVRIACLLALGVSLYLGGWLFRKIDAMEPGDSHR